VAVKVTDDPTLRRIADVDAAKGWQPTVRDGALYAEFSAPSAGPPPMGRVPGHARDGPRPRHGRAYAATRWRF
jgi:hypothetical protein